LLAGRQWELQPFTKRKTNVAQPLYMSWPTEDQPAFGSELDFAEIGRHLQARRDDLNRELDELNEPLKRPIGKYAGAANDNLKSFLTFSPTQPSPGQFLKYLGEVKNSTATNSWMRQWRNRPDSDQPEEVSANLQELYDLWIQKQPRDAAFLTVANKSATTNYFFDTWRRLKDNLKERELMQAQLENVQKRLVELGHVEYIGLLIVDPNQPGSGLEMIRFGGP
jgi:hypothetical protein